MNITTGMWKIILYKVARPLIRRPVTRSLTPKNVMKRTRLYTHFAIDCAKPGSTEDHLKPDSDYYNSILQVIEDAKSNADIFGKSLFVDCVKVSVLSGQANLTSNSADYLIAAFIHELRADICAKTGQATFPKFLISPFNDTGSKLCLAEGQLDINYPTLGIIVTSPPILAGKKEYRATNAF